MNSSAQKRVSDLPSSVRDFVASDEVVQVSVRLLKEFNLSEALVLDFLDILEETVLGSIKLSELPNVLRDRLGCSQDAAREMAAAFAGNLLLPIAFVVGDVESQIRAWGSDPAKFASVPRLEIPRENPQEFVKKFLTEQKVWVEDPILQSRLEYLLVSLATGKRTREDVRAALCRAPKIGGVDFAEETADYLLKDFDEARRSVLFASEETRKPSVISDIRPPVQPRPPPPPAVQRGAGQAGSEAEEIAKAAAVVKEKIAPAAKPALSAEEAVNRIIKEAELEFDVETRKRFDAAVEARLRDARDAFETRDLLERGQERGGLNIKGLQLARAMEALEKITSERLAAGLMEARRAKEETRQAKAAALKEAAVVPPPLPRLRPRPKPAVPIMSPGSAAPASRASLAGRPIMTDVAAPSSRRLAGPVEEFANMTTVEFRRLSSDPKEAVMKIKDRLDLLEEQGVGQKIAGIKAWRNSPINRFYLSLTRAALLSGRPVGEVSAEHGPDGLTDAEIKAISALNDQLRF